MLNKTFNVQLCHALCSCPLRLGEGSEEIVKVTFGELRRDVALFAGAMRKMGVQTGDRVVGGSNWRKRERDAINILYRCLYINLVMDNQISFHSRSDGVSFWKDGKRIIETASLRDSF